MDAPVRVRVAGVPLILHPGRNVVAVKTADASGHDRSGNIIPAVAIEVTDAHQDTILFFDHLRMEQEVPATFARVGKMFQFVGRYDDGKRKFGLPLCPGFTPIEAQTLYSPQ